MSLSGDETAPFVQLGDDDDSLVFEDQRDTDELRLAFEPRDVALRQTRLSSLRNIAVILLIACLVVGLVVCIVFLIRCQRERHVATRQPCLRQRCIALSAGTSPSSGLLNC